MKAQMLDLLTCTACQGHLALHGEEFGDGEILKGVLQCACGKNFPIKNGIPRFVPESNYADNFGFQWNRFRRTQLDSYSKTKISEDRFFKSTGWDNRSLEGKRILDIGCGAGRFSEIVLNAGGHVVAVDFSSAVDACRENLANNLRLEVVQADVYCLPFKPEQFDFVYILGVLQHTPDVRKTFMALPSQMRSGGRLAVDVYPKLWLNCLWPKYWLRPLTKRISPGRLFRLIELLAPVLLPISVFITWIPVVGRKLRHFVPVANYYGVYPLSKQQQVEWSILDTFDMFAPIHDKPQSIETLRCWFESAGMTNIEVLRFGSIVGRGVKQ